MKKWQYVISILAMVCLLVQSIIGVIDYFDTEKVDQGAIMMGQQPPNMQGNADSSSQGTTTDSNSSNDSSSTTESTTGEQGSDNPGNGNAQMTPPNGMDSGFPDMDRNIGKEAKSTTSLIGNIVGIILSLSGLVLTFLTWRKKAKTVQE